MKCKKFCLIFILFILISAVAIFAIFIGSLPCVSGHQKLLGLTNSVKIKRDKYGVPTIKGQSRLDIARATGFLHGQERFFQMDLMRRAAAGELSELFGNATVEFDKERRLHQFCKLSERIYESLTVFEKELLTAYAAGVNEGLKALRCKPFEYFLLREYPKAWTQKDSILVGLGLYFELQDPNGDINRVRAVLKEHLPPSVYKFFTQNGSHWHATLDNKAPEILCIPEASQFYYLRHAELIGITSTHKILPPLSKGSNQWAVSPSNTCFGKAVIACDMHLNLSVPNIWYRLEINYLSEDKENIKMCGISLPGTPLIAVGSNGHIAWGFTNAYIETSDLVLLDNHEQSELEPIEVITETIKVKGASPIDYPIKWTKYGPIHPKLFLGKKVAIRWVAHDIESFNFRLVDLEKIKSVNTALNALNSIHLPALNFMVADKEGHIGWSYVGLIPKRTECNPKTSISTANMNNWQGYLNADETPKIQDPVEGILWTANNRVIDNPSLGNDYLNPIRAYQIRDRLNASNQHSLKDLYSMQLDDEALFFERWYQLLLNSLNLNKPKHRQLYEIINKWDHRCSASSIGYIWIRTFREIVINQIANRLLSPCFEAAPDLNLSLLDIEEPIYLIASQKPIYLANPKYASFDDELAALIDEMILKNQMHFEKQKTWGTINKSKIQHPLSQAIPLLHYLLDMPSHPLSGDYYVPRVASPEDGASIRIVLSPGNEEEGILNIPCGQSGNPLSKHYRDQHKFWQEGISTPFLSGATQNELLLSP